MSFLQTNWMLILVFVSSGAMLLWPFLQRRLFSVKELGTSQATRLINDANPVILDVREDKEITGGRLPNAMHIPLSQLGARSSELASLTGRTVIVYCARGNRTALAARALGKLGFNEIFGLRGGMAAWREAGLPLAR